MRPCNAGFYDDAGRLGHRSSQTGPRCLEKHWNYALPLCPVAGFGPVGGLESEVAHPGG